MERIAYKTEQETISMHIITCVTLAFLPGTFVAVSSSTISQPGHANRDLSLLSGFLPERTD